jgi:cytochrome b561
MLTAMMPKSRRYTTVAMLLHWLVALVVVGQFALGWLMQEIPKSPPGQRAEVFNVHKSIGLTILLLMLARLAWRLGHPPPALPPMPRWQAWAALANHRFLYAVLIVMALAGYLGSSFSGYPVRFFGIVLPSWSAKHEALKALMSNVHLACAWLLAAAVGLHLAAVAKHALVDHDGILARMGWRTAPAHAARANEDSVTSARAE